jgi:E3 ubiquitin-protein ligase HECTD3
LVIKSSHFRGSKEEFNDYIDLKFTTILSNGKSVPLCENGENIKVTFDDIDRYKELILRVRINEAKKQMDAIREGFESNVPIFALMFLSWKNIEQKVCGAAQISVSDLKSIASYSNCNTKSEYIKRFWRVFNNFNNSQRAAFIKFAWGRSSLPLGDNLRKVKFVIMLHSEKKYSNHDMMLPQSHTCFFRVDLPRYSTDEICKKKILLAAEYCGAIDTDNQVAQNESDSDESSEGDDIIEFHRRPVNNHFEESSWRADTSELSEY